MQIIILLKGHPPSPIIGKVKFPKPHWLENTFSPFIGNIIQNLCDLGSFQ